MYECISFLYRFEVTETKYKYTSMQIIIDLLHSLNFHLVRTTYAYTLQYN